MSTSHQHWTLTSVWSVINHAVPDSDGDDTIEPNVNPYYYLCRVTFPYLANAAPGRASIIFNASIDQTLGHSDVLDYPATNGEIVEFMRKIHEFANERGARCNAVAPGPIWTPMMWVLRCIDMAQDVLLNTPRRAAATVLIR